MGQERACFSVAGSVDRQTWGVVAWQGVRQVGCRTTLHECECRAGRGMKLQLVPAAGAGETVRPVRANVM